MKEKISIKCRCGQTSHLVFVQGKGPGDDEHGWHYDHEKHGSDEHSRGACFNCKARLKDDTVNPPGVDNTASTESDSSVNWDDIDGLDTNRLIQLAERKGIDVKEILVAAIGGDETTDEKPLSRMNKAELLDVAEAEDVSIPDGATKAEIIEAIEAKLKSE